MLLNKPKAIVHLMRDSLEIHEAGIQDHIFTFPEGSVKNLEVVDGKTLVNELTKYLGVSGNPACSYILVLGEDVVFQKITVAKKPEERERRIQLFLDEVPIPPEKLIHRTHTVTKGTLITAVNRDLIDHVVRSFSQMEWKLFSVVPETIYGNAQMDERKISTILNDLKLAKQSGISLDENATKKPNTWLSIVVGLGLVFLLGLGGKLAYNYYFGKIYDKEPAVTVNEAPKEVDFTEGLEDTEETTESSEEEIEIAKDEIRITVLNGTGIPGLAGETATTLNGLGFDNTTAGNADTIGEKTTVVEYTEEVPQTYIDDIVSSLQDTFEEVDVKITLSDETQYKVTVTTGSLLTEEE